MASLKKVNLMFLDPKQDKRHKRPYSIMKTLIKTVHAQLKPAMIAIVFHHDWNADRDGRLTLGQLKLCTELDHEFSELDFVVILNKNFWMSDDVTDGQRLALIDHELSHAAPVIESCGGQKEDEKGRLVWRTKSHEITEFFGVITRNGFYTDELYKLAQIIKDAEETPLLKDEVISLEVPNEGQAIKDALQVVLEAGKK